MFDRTLSSSWDERSRLGFTTLTSFGLQIVVVAFLLVLPLLRPMGLPLLRQLSTPISLGRPLAEAPSVRPHAATSVIAPENPANLVFRAPSRIPNSIAMETDVAPLGIGSLGPALPGNAVGNADGVANVLSSNSHPLMPVVKPAVRIAPLRISHISEGNPIRQVQPNYPPLARTARIQGTVVLQALISKQGSIENLKVLTGPPMLVPAAIEAVKHWRYRPYVLNNEPVEVETQITVNFNLAGN